MRNYTYTTADGLHMTRVSRRTARRLHLQGLEICAAPCNLRPDSPWGTSFTLEPSEDFERFENSATWYNCANSETGRYLAWYAPAAAVTC